MGANPREVTPPERCYCGQWKRQCPGAKQKKKKTDSLGGAYIKVNIKLIDRAKCLLFSIPKNVVSSFVVMNLHRFTFVS